VSATLIARLAAVPTVGQDARPYCVSPDGGLLAFQWYKDGDWQIFLKGLPRGEPYRPAEVDDACWCPSFSPDGRYLYFARDDRGSECFDFYRCELATGNLENLLPDTPSFSPLPDFALSPDGSRIALIASAGAGYSVAVMPAAPCPGAEGLAYLSRHPYAEASPRWSPDGGLLAVTTGTRGQDTAIHLMTADGAESCIVGETDEFHAGQLAWSPDGRTIAFSGGPEDNAAIGLYDVASRAITWAWRRPLDAHHPCWSPDGRQLAFLVDRDAQTGLSHLDLRSGQLRELTLGEGNHYAPSFTAAGDSLLVVQSGPDHPADLFAVELPQGRATQITFSLPQDLAAREFVSGVAVTYTSLDHLTDVPALLVEPEEPSGAGVVIIHGGPTWHHANEWDALRQALAAQGVTVVHPNYRGSDGYGRRWQMAGRWLVGQGEALDCAGAHRFLVSLGCDPERIAVTGRSWGGFLTMAMITQFPELWAAAVAGVPFFDFLDAARDPAVREDLRWWDLQNTGDPDKDAARLAYYSPVNHLDRIRAPLLLLAGELDPRCPPRQVREVASALRAQGKACEAVVYPNEGHEISGLDHRVDYDQRTVEFLLQHTADRSARAPA
jgi:dipeptidyl aminopeptidase/acylaminoacyl peptidase